MNPESMMERLKEKGFKATPQRMEIMKILFESMGDHPSLNILHARVKENMPTVSFSTLYNTVSTLERNGLIRLFDHDGETRVEMNMENHFNLIDGETGNIIDMKDEAGIKEILCGIEKDKVKGKRILVNVILY